MNPPRLRELTPRGPGGVAVLELRGEGALERVAKLLPSARLTSGRLCLARIALGGEDLDEALVWCESPARVELHLHASPPLVARVRAELLGAGFADGSLAAEPRSLEERALDALAHAPSEAGARMLLDQAEGALRRELEACARLAPDESRGRIRELARRARRARYLLDPARVVLAGVVNAGKSTLFNALVGSERVLVSHAPGTTRDVVSEAALLGDWPVIVFDTAGERALEPRGLAEAVEVAGQELGRAARASADLVLWLAPADLDAPAAPPRAITVRTRADLRAGAGGEPDGLPSVAAGPEPRAAARRIAQLFREALDLPEPAWSPGEGVPFEPWMGAWLERAAGGAGPVSWEPLLAPR